MIPVPSEISFTAALPAAASSTSSKRRSTAPEDLPTASSTPPHFRARPTEFAAEVSQQRNVFHERRHFLPMISSIIRPASSYYYHASLGEQPLHYPPGAGGMSVNFGSSPSSLDVSHEAALRNHQQLQRDRSLMDQQLQREEQTRKTRHLHSRRTSWPISSSSEPQDPPQEPRRRRLREEQRVVSAADTLSLADGQTLPRPWSTMDPRLERHSVDSRKEQDEESSPSPAPAATQRKKHKVSHRHGEEKGRPPNKKKKYTESHQVNSTEGDHDIPTTSGQDVTAPSTRRLSWSGGTAPIRLTEEVTEDYATAFAAERRRQSLPLMHAAESDLTTTMLASSRRLLSLDQKLRLLRTGLFTPEEFGLAPSADVPFFASKGLSLLPTLPRLGVTTHPSVWDNAILLSHDPNNILRRQARLRDETLYSLDPSLSSSPLSVEESLLAGRRSSLYASPFSSSAALLSSSTALPPVRLHDDSSPPLRQSSSCVLPTDATLKHPEESSPPHARHREVVDEGFRAKPSSSGSRDSRNIRTLPLHSALDDTNVSEYQRLLRQQIELFEADEIEAQSNAQGRNKSIELGQVGIRCRHCNHVTPKRRATGAVYFPKKLDRVYQTAQKMADKHLLKVCQFIPEETKAQMFKVKSHFKSCDGGGKQYWGSALASRGVEETETRGLVFSSSNIPSTTRSSSI